MKNKQVNHYTYDKICNACRTCTRNVHAQTYARPQAARHPESSGNSAMCVANDHRSRFSKGAFVWNRPHIVAQQNLRPIKSKTLKPQVLKPRNATHSTLNAQP